MTAITRYILVGWLAVMLVACSGGSATREEDYDERVFAILAAQPEVDEENAAQATELLENFVDDLDDLNPPESLQDEHDALVDGYREVLKIVREFSSSDERWDPDDLETVTAAQDLDNAWLDAFGEHYGLYHFEVQGAAMQPSLQNGDHLKVPAYNDQQIVRGNIMVFEFHLAAEGEAERVFIKRVIGLPGETIEVRDGMVFVDGLALGEGYLLNTPTYTYGPKTVSAGSYFVLGDNRRNSYDSHQWANGCPAEQICDFVPEENIIGVLPADAKPYASTPD